MMTKDLSPRRDEADGVLTVHRLRREFRTPGGILSVLNDVSFTLRRGESLAVTGPSGSGKSTLLAILGTLLPPTSGSVTLDAIEWTALSEKRLEGVRRDQIGSIFQQHRLLAHCTALENILLPILADRAVRGEDSARAEGLLERVGLVERRDHFPSELSGGEAQRVAICRALIRSPELILADEPTGNLDAQNAVKVTELLIELVRDSKAMLVLSTHDARVARQADQRVRLDGGQGFLDKSPV